MAAQKAEEAKRLLGYRQGSDLSDVGFQKVLIGHTEMWACEKCGSLVSMSTYIKHREWHETVLGLSKIVAAVAARVPPSRSLPPARKRR